jgi:DNA-binding response OmpR family regulator
MGGKILIVEDDADTRRALEVRLRASGYDTVMASDGIMALQVAQKKKPDLILLDLGLPGGDGFSVMARFRQLTSLSSIPIIVFTGRDTVYWKERVLEAGAIALLPKPIDNEALLAAILSQLPGGGPDDPRQKAKKKIMIVDDDADIRLALSIRLKANGYEIALAADSTSAMTIGIKEKPDLIILDLGLPGGGGFLLMERLKRNPILGHAPIIILSAWDVAANEERALRAGAVAFFRKPENNEALLAAVHKALTETPINPSRNGSEKA